MLPVKMPRRIVIMLLLTLLLILQSTYAQKYIGDDCITNDQSAGKCVLLANCTFALNILCEGVYPKTCGYQKLEPIVCCRILNTTAAPVSERMCNAYGQLIPQIRPPSIVYGDIVPATDFPHMASLGFSRGNEKLWRCGGSLISNRFVLTAAHCLQSPEFGNLSWVRFGEQITPTTSEASLDYRISELIAHPEYKKPSSYNDIALLKLDRVVIFTVAVRPACLYKNPTLTLDTIVAATGYGLTSFAGEPSELLQKVDLDLFSEQECMATYESMAGTRRLNAGIKFESQICAGGRTIGKDTCQGDSGGPLQLFLDDLPIHSLVGITSFGKSCGLVNVPAVYTRVSYFIPWIESIVWPNQ